MFVKTDRGMLNLDYIVLVEINQQFMTPRDRRIRVKGNYNQYIRIKQAVSYFTERGCWAQTR